MLGATQQLTFAIHFFTSLRDHVANNEASLILSWLNGGAGRTHYKNHTCIHLFRGRTKRRADEIHVGHSTSVHNDGQASRALVTQAVLGRLPSWQGHVKGMDKCWSKTAFNISITLLCLKMLDSPHSHEATLISCVREWRQFTESTRFSRDVMHSGALCRHVWAVL